MDRVNEVIGDGAQPMHSTTLRTMYHSGDMCGGYITIPHRWIVLAVPLWDGSGWYIVTSDFGETVTCSHCSNPITTPTQLFQLPHSSSTSCGEFVQTPSTQAVTSNLEPSTRGSLRRPEIITKSNTGKAVGLQLLTFESTPRANPLTHVHKFAPRGGREWCGELRSA